MATPFVPPWVITPDAAGRYVQGYSLGIDVASKRAAQRVQQQQMALQQQSMMQRQQANAEIAARQAIQMQLDEQFRKAQLAADTKKLAQAKTLADAARDQAATLAGDRIASAEKIAGMRYGPDGGRTPVDVSKLPTATVFDPTTKKPMGTAVGLGNSVRILTEAGISEQDWVNREKYKAAQAVLTNQWADEDAKKRAQEFVDQFEKSSGDNPKGKYSWKVVPDATR